MFKLVIGNKNYSSWSLRAWLYMRESDLPFEEIRIPLFVDGWKERLTEYSPAARVPVLVDGDLRVWDTLAIIEYLREHETGAIGWPDDRAQRAHARSIAAEMHSGFLALREWLPQNIRKRSTSTIDETRPDLHQQIARVEQIWARCRDENHHLGPWLFGRMSIADVMFAPVALRFVTYSVPLGKRAAEFVEAVQGLPSIQEWARDSAAEPETIDFVDELIGTNGVPMSLG